MCGSAGPAGHAPGFLNRGLEQSASPGAPEFRPIQVSPTPSDRSTLSPRSTGWMTTPSLKLLGNSDNDPTLPKIYEPRSIFSLRQSPLSSPSRLDWFGGIVELQQAVGSLHDIRLLRHVSQPLLHPIAYLLTEDIDLHLQDKLPIAGLDEVRVKDYSWWRRRDEINSFILRFRMLRQTLMDSSTSQVVAVICRE